jgi:two-component system cell cycle response regulator DivK
MPKKILVVEDDLLNMRLFHDLLGSRGYDTVETGDGREAVELARLHRPDLILLDIQLAGMSGLEVARRLKADAGLGAVPVVAVTAFALRNDERRIRDSGCDAYIAKPFAIQTLLDVIEANIRSDDELAHDVHEHDDDAPAWRIAEDFAQP